MIVLLQDIQVIKKTLHWAKLDFYWPGMCADIKHYIKHCEMCRRNKCETLLPAGLLQPLPIPTRVWVTVFMDFIDYLYLMEIVSLWWWWIA
jgi:hypothetical protein